MSKAETFTHVGKLDARNPEWYEMEQNGTELI